MPWKLEGPLILVLQCHFTAGTVRPREEKEAAHNPTGPPYLPELASLPLGGS